MIRVTQFCSGDTISETVENRSDDSDSENYLVSGGGSGAQQIWRIEVGKERETMHVPLLTTGTSVLT